MARGAVAGGRRITFFTVFHCCDGHEALFRPGLTNAELRLSITPEQGDALRTVPRSPVCVVAEVDRDERGHVVGGTLKGLLGY